MGEVGGNERVPGGVRREGGQVGVGHGGEEAEGEEGVGHVDRAGGGGRQAEVQDWGGERGKERSPAVGATGREGNGRIGKGGGMVLLRAL